MLDTKSRPQPPIFTALAQLRRTPCFITPSRVRRQSCGSGAGDPRWPWWSRGQVAATCGIARSLRASPAANPVGNSKRSPTGGLSLFESYLAPAVAVTAALLVSPTAAGLVGVRRAAPAPPRAPPPPPRRSSRRPCRQHADGSIVKRGDTGWHRREGAARIARHRRRDLRLADGPRGRRLPGTDVPGRSGRVDRSTWRALFRSPVGSAGAGTGPGPGKATGTGTGGRHRQRHGRRHKGRRDRHRRRRGRRRRAGRPRHRSAVAGGPAPSPAAPGTCSPTTIATPLKGHGDRPFGDGRNHAGVDLAAPSAPRPRRRLRGVEVAGIESGYGNIVCIRHSYSVRDVLRPPLVDGRGPGTEIPQGQIDRPRRHDRSHDRPAPALRDARRRHRPRSGAVPRGLAHDPRILTAPPARDFPHRDRAMWYTRATA